MRHSNYIGIFIITAITLISCKRSENDILPGAEVNFFSAADGIFGFAGQKAIYIDKIDTNEVDPNKFTARTPTGETFPSLSSAGPSGTAIVLYVKQAPGNHRFYFTNGKKYLVADTTFDLTAGSKHSFYVYDDPDSLLYRCRVLHLIENGPAPVNESRFRLLHFSSDLGQMNSYFVMEDGSRRFPANLPTNLKYGNYSDYITLDESVVGKDGNAYLQFFSGTDTATVKATATIPYRKGRSYAVVVSGLANTKFVQYNDPANPGNTTSVQLNASIAARVRIIN
jgi:hypothetical protein